MKTIIRFSGAVVILASCLAIALSAGCKKKSSTTNNTGNCQCWNQNWLIGTWEGTTPLSIQPFAGKKIRIVFQKAHLQQQDTISGNIRKTWTYSGIFTWDVDSAAWNMSFDSTHFPLANTILFECLSYCAAGLSVNNVSLRIADLTQADPLHTIDLDWGPVNSGDGVSPTYIDMYGDIQLDFSGVIYRAEYPPEAGKMIRLTKK
jgi:hypothetical protein